MPEFDYSSFSIYSKLIGRKTIRSHLYRKVFLYGVEHVARKTFSNFPDLEEIVFDNPQIVFEEGAIVNCPKLSKECKAIIQKHTIQRETNSKGNGKKTSKTDVKLPNRAPSRIAINKAIENQCHAIIEEQERLRNNDASASPVESVRLERGGGDPAVLSAGRFSSKDCIELTIGLRVKHIRRGAISNCPKLEIVHFENGQTTVEDGAFLGCPKLDSGTVKEIARRRPLTTLQESNANSIVSGSVSSVSDELHFVVSQRPAEEDMPYLGRNSVLVYDGLGTNKSKVKKTDYLWCRVPLYLGLSGRMIYVPLVVARSSHMNKYFLFADAFNMYLARYNNQNNTLLVNFTCTGSTSKFRLPKQGELFLRDESTLKMLGYSVSQNNGLSQRQRIDILKHGIESGVVTKYEVEKMLQFFIRFHGSRANMDHAVDCWSADLRSIHQMTFSRRKML